MVELSKLEPSWTLLAEVVAASTVIAMLLLSLGALLGLALRHAMT